MRDDIRERFFTPYVLPVTVIGIMLLFGMSLSRVLLAVSEMAAALIAVFAAGYIMLMAFYIESRRRIPSRTLGVALVVGFIGIVTAGAVASAAGMREVHGEEGEAAAGAGEGEAAAEGGGSEPVFVAIDIAYESAPETLPLGTTTITLENRGTIEHNVVFEDLDDLLVAEAPGGETATGDVTLEEPGEYVYYCSIPGHREAGMEGTLTAEEGAAAGGAAEGGASEAASEAGGDAEASEAAGDEETGAGGEAEDEA